MIIPEVEFTLKDGRTAVLRSPREEYTKRLMASVPKIGKPLS